MKTLLKMTKMSFIFTMVLCLLLVNITNLHANRTNLLNEEENNQNLQYDNSLDLATNFIKDDVLCNKDPDGLKISTTINKEGHKLTDLKIVAILANQKIIDNKITYTTKDGDLIVLKQDLDYTLSQSDDLTYYILSLEVEVRGPINLEIKTKILFKELLLGEHPAITNSLEIYASEYSSPVVGFVRKKLPLSDYLDLKLLKVSSDQITLDLTFKTFSDKLDQHIVINYSKELILTKESLKDLNKKPELFDLKYSDGEILIFTKTLNLNLSFDFKINTNEVFDSDTKLYAKAKLGKSNLEVIQEFSYSPVIIDNLNSKYVSEENKVEASLLIQSTSQVDDLKIQVKSKELNLETVVVKDLRSGEILILNQDYKLDKATNLIYINKSFEKLNLEITTSFSLDSKSALELSLNFYIYGIVDKKINLLKAVNVNLNHSEKIKDKVVGSYDAISKVITWEILANFQDNKNYNNIINTRLSEKEKYIKDSLRITQYQPLNKGKLKYIKDLKPTDYLKTYDEGSKSLTINIKNSQPAIYKITIKTSLANEEIDYFCHHQSFLKINFLEKLLETSIKIPFVNLHLNKLGKQSENLIQWTILLNEKQSSLAEVEVYSFLDKEHTYIKDSFEVFSTVVKSDGSYTLSKLPLDASMYSINFITGESEGFNFKIIDLPIDIPYILTYKTQPSLKSFGHLTSTAVLNKKEMASETVAFTPKYLKPSIPEKLTGSYTVTKLDLNNKPLANVGFELERVDNNQIYKASTNNEGIAIFENLDYTTYRLKEVSPRPGYIVDLDLILGIKVEINKKQTKASFINKQAQLSIKSVNKDLESLSGGVFSLKVKKAGTYIKVVDNFIIDKEKIFYGLGPGKYKLSQVKNVDNYIQNLEEVDFEIIKNKDTKLVYTSYKGSLLVYDQSGDNFITGASFSLIDLENNIIDLHTLKQNPYKVEDLPPKAYLIKSNTSAFGYNHINKEVEFKIIDKAYKKPEPVIVLFNSEKLNSHKKVIVPTGLGLNKLKYLVSLTTGLLIVFLLKREL